MSYQIAMIAFLWICIIGGMIFIFPSVFQDARLKERLFESHFPTENEPVRRINILERLRVWLIGAGLEQTQAPIFYLLAQE